MTEPTKTNGSAAQGGGAEAAQLQVGIRVLGQYVRDLSFESPNIRKLMTSQAENPNLELEMNVSPEQVAPDVFETTLSFTAKANAPSIGIIFEMEIDYCGIFRIENAPPEMLDAILHIQCPSLLFPFLRRIVADTTRDGGIMPPLMLDPVDFATLYMRKRAAMAGEQPQA
jgi:preprotein translocase subunit SecB